MVPLLIGSFTSSGHLVAFSFMSGELWVIIGLSVVLFLKLWVIIGLSVVLVNY